MEYRHGNGCKACCKCTAALKYKDVLHVLHFSLHQSSCFTLFNVQSLALEIRDLDNIRCHSLTTYFSDFYPFYRLTLSSTCSLPSSLFAPSWPLPTRLPHPLISTLPEVCQFPPTQTGICPSKDETLNYSSSQILKGALVDSFPVSVALALALPCQLVRRSAVDLVAASEG